MKKQFDTLAVAVAAAAATAATLAAPQSLRADVPDWSGFAKEVKITFDGYAGATPLENFPALVRVSAANGFDYAKFKLSGGGDLRFADADGNLLAHEIDTWTPDGESLVWVKVTRLSSETEIFAYYGNATPAAAPASSGVWSEGYAGVWHMNAAADKTTQADSTANGKDATVPVAVADGVEAGVSGVVGTAAEFDKRSDHKGGYSVPDTSQTFYGQTAMTWEVWAKQASYAAYNAYFFRMQDISSGTSPYTIYSYANTGRPVAYPWLEGASAAITYWPGDALIPPLDRWNHIVWRYDGANGTKAVVLNGNTSGKYSWTADKGTILSISGNGNLIVGNFTGSGNGNAFPGALDEIRISTVARSDDWIAATYATVRDSSFASYEAIAKGGNDWTKYAKKFRISFPGVGSGVTLTNFPVLVKLSASSPSGFRYADCAKADGGDLRFADSEGNALESEVETWNDGNGESFVWVKVPTLTSSTKITGYYGWAEAPSADAAAVWDEGFLAVWHLNAAAGETTQSDSTSAGRNLALAGESAGVAPGVAGVAGKAAAFNASDTHKGVYSYANSDGALTGFTNITVEAWTKTAGAPSYNNGYLLFCGRDSATAYQIYQKKDTFTLTTDYYIDKDGTATYCWGGSAALDGNAWDHVAFRYDGSNGTSSVVLNGAAGAPRAPGAYGLMAGAGAFYLGNRDGSRAYAFPGSLDEVRISNVARSDAWLAATRATIADNAAFTTYGAASDNSQGTVVFFR